MTDDRWADRLSPERQEQFRKRAGTPPPPSRLSMVLMAVANIFFPTLNLVVQLTLPKDNSLQVVVLIAWASALIAWGWVFYKEQRRDRRKNDY